MARFCNFSPASLVGVFSLKKIKAVSKLVDARVIVKAVSMQFFHFYFLNVL